MRILKSDGKAPTTILEHPLTDIYTDGSRDPIGAKVGFGMCIPSLQIYQSKHLNDSISITAELVALLWTLN